MKTKFNFKGLHSVFIEAIDRHEPSIAFSLTEGIGKFVFLIFIKTNLSGSIVWGELELFVLLARTQRMLCLKLYGNHKVGGNFEVWMNDADKDAIKDELGLRGATQGPAFSLTAFLTKLDSMIPSSIPLETKIETLQSHRNLVSLHCGAHVDASSKIYLFKVGPLPTGYRPREETLRKLYMLDAPTHHIAQLIENLKSIRWTTYWTATKPDTDRFSEIFAKVAAATPLHRVG